MKAVEQFAVGVVMICVMVMRGVGVVDDQFSAAMRDLGVFSPDWQLCVLLGLTAFYVVLALRSVGGMLGWAMLFFAVLLLMHRTVPSLTAPGLPVAAQFQGAL